MRLRPDALAGMLSNDCRGRNAALVNARGMNCQDVKVNGRERPKPRGNVTERRALELIRARYPDGCVFSQPARFFPLEGGGTYTPDFLVFREGRPVVVVEVKGGYRGPGAEQGIERYRRAAAQWDGCLFAFQMWNWKAKERGWEIFVWAM